MKRLEYEHLMRSCIRSYWNAQAKCSYMYASRFQSFQLATFLFETICTVNGEFISKYTRCWHFTYSKSEKIQVDG